MGEEYRRPVATLDRYEKLQAVAAQAHPALPVILALAHHTARRIRAILALRYRDLVLTRSKEWPHGGIVWPGMTDKQGREWVAPLNGAMRAVLDAWLAAHPGIGDACLFPDPRTRTHPVLYDTASKWLRKAETLANIEKQNGTLWHGYRRGWAIARKNLPVQDVAAAGGWRNVNTVQQIYQAPDPSTMYVVVSQPGIELRETGSS
jgi:integrase